MKKILLFLLTGFVLTFMNVYAQNGTSLENEDAKPKFYEPAVKVNKLYYDENRLTDKDGNRLTKRQLLDLLIEKYSKSKVLESQLRTLNLQPIVTVPEFPKQISRKRSKELTALIGQYDKIAQKLSTQVSGTKVKTLERVEFLMDSVQNSISEMMYQHEKEKLKLYEEQRKKFDNYYEKLKQEKLNELFGNSVQVFNASIVGRQYFLPGGQNLSSDFSLGGKFELSLYPIFNSADFLELYGEFMKPRFLTHDAMDNEYSWNINWYSAGINLKVPGRLDLKAFTMGMRIGAGYYWAEARQYNSGGDKSDWRGYNLNFELDFMKYTWFYPLDIFIQYSLYYPTQDFAFNTGDGTINLGKDMFSGLSVGLRLCLWWEEKY